MSADQELLSRTTLLLRQMQEGVPAASEQLFELLYGHLKDLARQKMAGARSDHTLQATAVVHELWLRIQKNEGLQVASRQHFMRIAANAMRGVLVDHARRRGAEKRKDQRDKVPLDEALAAWEADRTIDPLTLDELLERLRGQDARLADVVELRFFAGLSEEETAEVLELSRRQVQHAWKLARAWLQRELERGDADPG